LYNRHGAQGTLDSASKGTLENEFGTHVEEECIKQILEKGNLQESEVRYPAIRPHCLTFLLSYPFNVLNDMVS
jgi:hypothetical protein